MERGPPKISWIGLIILGCAMLLDGISLVLLRGEAVQRAILDATGMTWTELANGYPQFAGLINDLTLALGLGSLVVGIITVAIAATKYKDGEYWAWMLAWAYPLYYLLESIPSVIEGDFFSTDTTSVALLLTFAAMAAIVQVYHYWAFFRGRPRAGRPYAVQHIARVMNPTDSDESDNLVVTPQVTHAPGKVR